MKENSPCPTYQRILDTSLRLMKTEGLKAITVRRVAAEASVNIAAVNYHFKGKENLIDAVIDEIAAPVMEKFEELSLIPDMPPREKLKQFLITYAHYIRNFPQPLLRWFAFENHQMHNTRRFIELKKFGVEELKKIVSQLIPEADDTRILVTAIQIFSAIALPTLVFILQADTYQKSGINLPSIEEQVDLLLENFLKK